MSGNMSGYVDENTPGQRSDYCGTYSGTETGNFNSWVKEN